MGSQAWSRWCAQDESAAAARTVDPQHTIRPCQLARGRGTAAYRVSRNPAVLLAPAGQRKPMGRSRCGRCMSSLRRCAGTAADGARVLVRATSPVAAVGRVNRVAQAAAPLAPPSIEHALRPCYLARDRRDAAKAADPPAPMEHALPSVPARG